MIETNTEVTLLFFTVKINGLLPWQQQPLFSNVTQINWVQRAY